MSERRDPIAAAAVALAVVAFAGSFTHVRSVVDANGQHGWLAWAIASMPEVSVLLAVLKIRRGRSTGEATTWAWVVGVSAAGFTLSANLATAQHSAWGYVAAAWPAWASVGATGLIHVSDRAENTPEVPEPTVEDLPAPIPSAGPPEAAPLPGPLPPATAERQAPQAVVQAVIASSDVPVSGRGQSDEQLLNQLLEAIRTRVLPADPSAEQIRRHLGVAWKRGATLKARLEAEAVTR
jgi:hypothetical protein